MVGFDVLIVYVESTSRQYLEEGLSVVINMLEVLISHVVSVAVCVALGHEESLPI